jgi:hypothetical protein
MEEAIPAQCSSREISFQEFQYQQAYHVLQAGPVTRQKQNQWYLPFALIWKLVFN